MNDEPNHKHRKYWLFCLFAVFIAILGVVLPEPEFTSITYINASDINYNGLINVNGTIANISDLNVGNWSADETTSPWWINITFTNITHFDYPEAKVLYYSVVGASTHVNDMEIYCVTDQAFVDLTTFTNKVEWWYFTRRIPDSMHFIDGAGNVTIRLNHTQNGNVNHRIKLDTVRLVVQPQYESVTTVQNTYNTIGGGGIAFNGSPVDVMYSRLYNISNQSNITGYDFHFLDGGTFNGTVDGGRGRIQNVSFLSLQNSGTAGFDIQNMGSTVVCSLAVGTVGNANIYCNWNSTTNNVSDPSLPVWAIRLGVNGSQLNKLRVIWERPFDPDPQGNIAGNTGYNNTPMEIDGNSSVNISYRTDLILKNSTGSGNAYVCIDANGKIFRGNPGC